MRHLEPAVPGLEEPDHDGTELHPRTEGPTSPLSPHRPGSGPGSLPLLRKQIEEVDRELIDLISRRCQLARATGVEKSSAGLPLEDPAREARVVRLGASLARDRGLDEEGVRQILWCLIGLARRTQKAETTPTSEERPHR
jgi:chorismate mutase